MEAPSMNPNMNVGPGGMNPLMNQIQQFQGSGPGQGPYNAPVAGELNIHPAVIKQFTDMGPAEQARLAQANPQFVQQIYHTMQRMAHQQQEQHMQGVRPKQHKEHDTDTDTESISTSSVLSSELENSHSSDDGSGSGSGAESARTRKDRKKKHRKKKSREEAPDTDDEEGPKFNFSGEASSAKASRSHKGGRKDRGHKHRKERKDRRKPHRDLVVDRDDSGVRVERKNTGVSYLSLDFRKDLTDVEGDKYVLSFPTQHNVHMLELESCVINRNQTLDREPYIYITLDEVNGDYDMNSMDQKVNVFGKLIQERTVNEFIMYKPENCVKVFRRPTRLDRLTVSFRKYDLDTVSINKLPVRHLGKLRPKASASGPNPDFIKVTTKSAHHLDAGDNVNISSAHDDRQTVDSVEVVEVVSEDTVILDSPVTGLSHDMRLQFEKVNLKCTLTFKLRTVRS